MLTVITPSSSKALTTHDAVGGELGVSFHGDFALVSDMILRASAMVESFCGRSFGIERVQQAVRPLPHGGVLPSRWPVKRVVTLTPDDAAADPSGVWIEDGLFSRRQGWGGVASITYDAGYVLPTLGYDAELPLPPWADLERDLPHDVERAVIELVKNDWLTRNRDKTIRSESVDGLSNLSFFGSGSTVSAILAPLASYRMPVAL